MYFHKQQETVIPHICWALISSLFLKFYFIDVLVMEWLR